MQEEIQGHNGHDGYTTDTTLCESSHLISFIKRNTYVVRIVLHCVRCDHSLTSRSGKMQEEIQGHNGHDGYTTDTTLCESSHLISFVKRNTYVVRIVLHCVHCDHSLTSAFGKDAGRNTGSQRARGYTTDTTLCESSHLISFVKRNTYVVRIVLHCVRCDHSLTSPFGKDAGRNTGSQRARWIHNGHNVM